MARYHIILALSLILGACRSEEPRGFFQRPPRGRRYVFNGLVPVKGSDGGWSSAAPETLERLRSADPNAPEPEAAAFLTPAQAPPSPLPAHSVRLLSQDGARLSVEGFQMWVRVDGLRARVLAEVFVLNDQPTALPARLEWRLPDDACLAGALAARSDQPGPSPRFRGVHEGAALAALDPRAPMPPGEGERVVAASQVIAAAAEARRAPSKALREPWSGAGVLRVPIPSVEPGRLYRIAVVYERDFQARDGRFILELPLPRDIAYRCIDLSLAGLPEGARLDPPAPRRSVGGRRRARYEKPGLERITITAPADRGLVLAEGEDFAVDVLVPELPETEAASAPRALFLLDVSASVLPRAYATALAFIEATLKESAPELRSFAVLAFNSEAHLWDGGFGANSPERRARFLARARSWAREGSSDLARAWTLGQQSADGPLDIYLLSDGQHVASSLPGLSAERRRSLFVLRLGEARAAHAHQAEDSGGAVIPLALSPEPAELLRAARANRRRPWMLRAASLSGGPELRPGGALRSGARLRLFGRGERPAAPDLNLVAQRGAEQRRLELALAPAIRSPLLRRARAQAALLRVGWGLGGDAELARRAGLGYQIPGPGTALSITAKPAPAELVPELDEALGAVFAAGAGSGALEPLRSILGSEVGLSAAERRELASLVAASEGPAPIASGPAPTETAALPAEYRAALSLGAPREAFAVEGRRRARRSQGAAAFRALSSALDLAPKDASLRRDLAFAALALGLPERVESLAIEGLDDLLLLALARREAGRPRAARAAAKLGLRLSGSPGSARAEALGLEARGRSEAVRPMLVALWNREDWDLELDLREGAGRSPARPVRYAPGCAVASLTGAPRGLELVIRRRGEAPAGPRRAYLVLMAYGLRGARLRALELPRDRRELVVKDLAGSD